MREVRTSLPLIALIGATRGLLGVGVGLLLSERIGLDRRREIGIALAALGALSTIPLALRVFRERKAAQVPTVANVPQSGFDRVNEEILAH
ncbi:MAG TPA: hypothetical protein VL326_35230 [Kofleriaceae bacterium]|jgi:hypothetical protein|nr:hypothetical protein [Kofleriaceae bacterium]